MEIWSDALSHLNVTGMRYVNYVEISLRGAYSDDDNGDHDGRVVGSYNTTRYQDRDGPGGDDDNEPDDNRNVPKLYSLKWKCPGCLSNCQPRTRLLLSIVAVL